MSTPWDAHAYDQTSEPQQAWAADVLARLQGIAADATVLGSVAMTGTGCVWPGAATGRRARRRSVAVRETSVASVRSSSRSPATCSATRRLVPWVFAGPPETERRLRAAGFATIRCWLEDRPTSPQDVDTFVGTSTLTAHLARLPEERRERFAAAAWQECARRWTTCA